MDMNIEDTNLAEITSDIVDWAIADNDKEAFFAIAVTTTEKEGMEVNNRHKDVNRCVNLWFHGDPDELTQSLAKALSHQNNISKAIILAVMQHLSETGQAKLIQFNNPKLS